MPEAKPQRAAGADPVRVDAKHYSIEYENDRIRILRARYGPREKSVMHSHPALVAIFLSETNCRFTFPDGRTEEHRLKAGQVLEMPPTEHLPENLSNSTLEVILVEQKP